MGVICGALDAAIPLLHTCGNADGDGDVIRGALRVLAVRVAGLVSEIGGLATVQKGVDEVTRCAVLEVELQTEREIESAARKGVSLTEALEWQNISGSFKQARCMLSLNESLEAAQALLRHSDTLPHLPRGKAYACLQLLHEHCLAMRRHKNEIDIITRASRDVVFGVLTPLEQKGVCVTYLKVLARVIHLNPAASQPWCNLADNIHDGGTARLVDGRYVSREEAFRRSLELDPTNWPAMCFFASHLGYQQRQVLADGSVVTRASLYKQAIDLNPGYGVLYNKLTLCLEGDATIRLREAGRPLSRRDLLKMALAYNPEVPRAYTDLGACLADGEKTALENGLVMTKEQLYKRSIAICSNHHPVALGALLSDGVARSYNNLANCLPDGGTTELEDGTVMTQEELYKRAIALDPGFSNAYNNLGTCMRFGRLTTLEDGTVLSKQDVFERAIALDPNNQCAVENLDDFDRWSARFSTQGGSSSESRSSHAK